MRIWYALGILDISFSMRFYAYLPRCPRKYVQSHSAYVPANSEMFDIILQNRESSASVKLCHFSSRFSLVSFHSLYWVICFSVQSYLYSYSCHSPALLKSLRKLHHKIQLCHHPLKDYLNLQCKPALSLPGLNQAA